jgi:hypothetical protein
MGKIVLGFPTYMVWADTPPDDQPSSTPRSRRVATERASAWSGRLAAAFSVKPAVSPEVS